MQDHQNTWLLTEAQQLDALHAKQLAQWQNILFAWKEGVFEITIRSQSITETVTLDGGDLTYALAEVVSDKLSDTESRIRHHAGNVRDRIEGDKKDAADAAAYRAQQEEKETQQAMKGGAGL